MVLKRISIFVVVQVLSLFSVLSQISPAIDQNWVLLSNQSDEFPGSSINNLKWDAGSAQMGIGWGMGSVYPLSHVIVNSGLLRLRWSYGVPFSSVGQIRSKNANFGYGYFEVFAKMLEPGNFSNGIPCANGLWPSFWTYFENLNDCIHDEIDVVETLYKSCSDVNIMGMGIWDYQNEGTPPCQGVKRYENNFNHFSPLFSGFNKYGAEWLSDRVIFYLNDFPVGEYRGVGIPQVLQYVVLSMQTHTGYGDLSNVSSPQDFVIDYFRYYKLKYEHCNDNIHLLDATDIQNFQFGVYKNITLGAISSSIVIQNNSNLTFRASEEINVIGEFEVASGSELNLINTPCN